MSRENNRWGVAQIQDPAIIDLPNGNAEIEMLGLIPPDGGLYEAAQRCNGCPLSTRTLGENLYEGLRCAEINFDSPEFIFLADIGDRVPAAILTLTTRLPLNPNSIDGVVAVAISCANCLRK